jgi:hypothetical protein
MMGGSRQYTAVLGGYCRKRKQYKWEHVRDINQISRQKNKKRHCHELLTFATRWRSVPATVDITDQISTTDDLVAVVARVWGHAQIVTRVVDQYVTAVGNSGRHPALNIWRCWLDTSDRWRRRIVCAFSTYICIRADIRRRNRMRDKSWRLDRRPCDPGRSGTPLDCPR